MNKNLADQLHDRLRKLDIENTLIMRAHNRLNDISYNNMLHVLEASNVGYFEWDRLNKALYVSDWVFKYSGASEGDSYYKMLSSVMIQASFNKYIDALYDLESEQCDSLELEAELYSHVHQEIRNVRIHLFFASSHDGKDRFISGTVQDITSRIREVHDISQTKNMLKQIINVIPLPLFFVNRQGIIEFGNRAVETMPIMPVADWYGKPFAEYYENVKNHLNIISSQTISGTDRHTTHEIVAETDGHEYQILVDDIKVYNNDDEVCGRLIIYTDVTDKVQNAQYVHRLLRANTFLLQVGDMVNQGMDMDTLYKNILNGILDIIPNAYKGCILLMDFNSNIYIRESVGYEKDYAKQFRIPFYSSFASMVLNGNYRKSVFINNIQEKYGDLFPDVNSEERGFVLQSNITSPINVNGKLYGLISIDSGDLNGFDETDLNLVDFLRGKIELAITRFKELSQVIETSTKDELTGVFNRHFYRKIVESLIGDCTLNKETFSMVVFDIDDLKVVNDTMGHLAGDELLKTFANTMRSNMREDDVLARIGGDEFVGLFRNIDMKRLEQKIEKIKAGVYNEGIGYNGSRIDIRFSYGISQFPVDGETEDKLMSKADKRMYSYKATNKQS